MYNSYRGGGSFEFLVHILLSIYSLELTESINSFIIWKYYFMNT